MCMKVAVLISGEPRFCTNFDKFMECIKNYNQVDYYIYIWKHNPQEYAVKNMKLIGDPWITVDYNWALKTLKKHIIQPNHSLKTFKLGNQEDFPEPVIDVPKADETRPRNVWYMHNAWDQVNKLKIQQEQNENFKYDLVINGRSDLNIGVDLDCSKLIEICKAKNPCVLTPDNNLYGHNIYPPMSDIFALGTSESMDAYMDIAQSYNKYLKKSRIFFHPETWLAHHLRRKQITDIKYEFKTFLRPKKRPKFFQNDFTGWE